MASIRKILPIRFDGVARRIIVALILFSSILTTIITAVELLVDYDRDISGIENRLNFIEKSYLPTIVESVWVSDGMQIQTQLDGLSHLQDIEHLGIRVNGAERWSAGAVVSTRKIVRDVPLVRRYRGSDVAIGTLQITASVDNVLARLWDKLIGILVSNFFKTALVAIFMLGFYQLVAGRHLEHVARYLRPGPGRLAGDEPLTLDRPATGRWRPDALDAVVTAVNEMQADVAASQAEVVSLNRELEARIAERTANLADALELNNLILATSAVGIAAYRASGECVFANEAVASMVGGTHEEVIKRNFRTVPSWRQYGLLDAALTALDTGIPQRETFHMVTTFGREAWYDCVFARFFRGGEAHLLITIEDISDKKRAESELRYTKEEAERANRAKSEFLSRMSHELRTPLNAILGFAQLMELDLKSATSIDPGGVKEILHAGRHLLDLINDILDLSRIEAGQLQLALEPVGLAQLVADCCALVQPLARKRGIALRVDEGSVVHRVVMADRTRLRQVLINLLSNAIKYNRDNGTVDIEGELVDTGRYRITVKDTGMGIAPDEQELLFRPFERLGADKGSIEGTGIGLALSKRLAEMMRGVIGVASTPGQGSAFWVEFDLAEGRQSIASEGGNMGTTTPSLPTEGTLVLYVEDNAANARLVEDMLARRADTRLILASTGELGLSLAETYKPDLILLDINLPGKDGFEIIKLLRANEETRDIPVVGVSANAMETDIRQAEAAGFDAYLTKPIKLTEFYAVVDRMLERAKLGSSGS